ncbi:MAG: winged helix-turn-helix domain-containing protein [Woeseiaceae bacterium]|nr:winged helix-turn-helix domain-containing protein [Woeseiaceae bacterium]
MRLASILVVDDDASSRSLIAGGLRQLGHYVSESDNALLALADVQRSQHDLMILVGKPTDMPRLLARVDEGLAEQSSLRNGKALMSGGITIDHVGHRVSVDGQYVSLAPREYRLLLFLMTHQDRVFSRDQLLVHVWDRDASVGPRTVDVHIRRLRSVLEPFTYDKYLQTVRGSGYRFSLNP